jgi:hypothetical protein
MAAGIILSTFGILSDRDTPNCWFPASSALGAVFRQLPNELGRLFGEDYYVCDQTKTELWRCLTIGLYVMHAPFYFPGIDLPPSSP